MKSKFNIEQFIKELICVTIRFGHQLVRRGNQNCKYIKCIKCGRKYE